MVSLDHVQLYEEREFRSINYFGPSSGFLGSKNFIPRQRMPYLVIMFINGSIIGS